MPLLVSLEDWKYAYSLFSHYQNMVLVKLFHKGLLAKILFSDVLKKASADRILFLSNGQPHHSHLPPLTLCPVRFPCNRCVATDLLLGQKSDDEVGCRFVKNHLLSHNLFCFFSIKKNVDNSTIHSISMYNEKIKTSVILNEWTAT